jgi:membrane-associated protease RseP (regulator of RpoE activity)
MGRVPVSLHWGLLWNGLWYSAPLLAILGAHESGHYLLCRRYNVDATLPYFIPLLVPSYFQIGTLGAVIRIRERFPTKSILFDIGIAGPIAGFLVLVPVLVLGLEWSTVVPAPPESADLLMLGEPLLFRWAAALIVGDVPQGYSLNAHPMVFAAWFGMLATALNLLPFGQLDGGHITYATLGRLARPLSVLTVAAAVVMTFFSVSWIAMTVLLILMTVVTGFGHPPVVNAGPSVGRARYVWAIVALVMLILCFTPVPISLVAPP